MRVVACLSWYDEPTGALTRTVASLEGFADTVLAVDGAYAAYPGAAERPTSPPEQADAIVETAFKAGLGCSIVRKDTPWEGGEVEKRARLLQRGVELAGDGGWLLVIDGDEYLHPAEPVARRALEECPLDVGYVWFEEGANGWKARRLFRALPGLTVIGSHFNYVTGDGRTLWGERAKQEPAANLTGLVKMRHAPALRTATRTRARVEYYRRRNERKLEARLCELCRESAAIHHVAADLQPAAAAGMVDAGWVAVCESCTATAVKAVVAEGRAMRLPQAALRMLARKRGTI